MPRCESSCIACVEGLHNWAANLYSLFCTDLPRIASYTAAEMCERLLRVQISYFRRHTVLKILNSHFQMLAGMLQHMIFLKIFFQTMLKQQQRVVQQSCIAMNQRLKNVRQLFEQYNKVCPSRLRGQPLLNPQRYDIVGRYLPVLKVIQSFGKFRKLVERDSLKFWYILVPLWINYKH